MLVITFDNDSHLVMFYAPSIMHKLHLQNDCFQYLSHVPTQPQYIWYSGSIFIDIWDEMEDLADNPTDCPSTASNLKSFSFCNGYQVYTNISLK